uniref:Cadherin domain-containing protein n=1 Tax=Knipowitschia caucasica TaxID=637954 RepID=A0AAV2LRT8_KNICA
MSAQDDVTDARVPLQARHRRRYERKGRLRSANPQPASTCCFTLTGGGAGSYVSGKTLKYQIYEEQKVGTVIARLRDDVADILAKFPSSVSLRFRAVQRGTSSLLTVRELDGEISVRTKIDREKLCEKNLNCSIQFDVLTLPTEHLQLFHVDVEVLDINDNAPQFARPVIPIEISESAAVGARIPLDSATDPDVGENSLYTYALEPNTFFKIDIQSRSDGVKYAELVVLKELDREVRSGYELQYTASDRGVPQRTGSTLLKISVTDSNDNSPVFEKSSYVINLPENSAGNGDAAYISEASPLDTFVALVRVEDLDSGLNGEVECKLHGQGYFKLQKTYENNYLILTNVSLDREKRSEFSLTVVAEDKGSPSLSTIKHFTVHVTDENDNPPRFEKGRYEIFKSENNAPGAYLTSIMATDPDLDTNGQVSYSVLENSVHGSSISTYVTIDPSNGAIYALRTFDREDVSRISFVVQAKDSGKPSLSTNATVILNILDENDNPPIIVVPQLWNFSADIPASKFTEAGQLVTMVRATDRDTGVNAELICSIVSGNEEGFFLIEPRTCEIHANASLDSYPHEHAELTVVVRDQGSESLSAKAVLKITLYENMENHVQVMDQGESSLDVSLIIIISLGAICAVLLVIMVAFAAHCNREKKDTRNSYNCRVAESTHQHHPKKPTRQIHKNDITLVPTVNGTLPIRSHHRSPSTTPPMDRAQMGSRQNHHSRQSLNSLVTISSNHIPESFALELAHATPPVEGQYQPRPSFRGNKYSRSYRYALQDMDKFSLKDSGRGDSEAGDSDCEMGRESPVDRLLLGEGFSDLIHLEMHHRLHPAMRLCTDECRVLGHSDQCWMPPLSLPQSSSDYRNNMYIPGEESTQPPQQQTDDDQSSVDSERRKSFSTFGKEPGSEEAAGGAMVEGSDVTGGGAGSLLNEMNSVFQRLLPPNVDGYAECNETSQPVPPSAGDRAVGRANANSNNAVPQDSRRGLLPGGKGAPYPPGVAAWAANTHYLNPASNNHISNTPTNTSTSTSTSTNVQPPHLKWLPAMEEIPENYEEDEFDGVFHQGGKRNEGRHDTNVDASELVHEINKLLQDVRQN